MSRMGLFAAALGIEIEELGPGRMVGDGEGTGNPVVKP